ncbi:MAG: hypothetical protein H8E42_05570 [Nitrospinae bacterium]|nr:hypothetical protein [Nitrospinota bacterium]MBL7018935.1 hypothetical protein [Nitrospinaceae bacterium]
MDINEARAYLNYLLTLGLRQEEAFGPMALDFIRETDFDAVGFLPEEQFSLVMATVQALAQEPKRYTLKLEMLNRALGLVDKTTYKNPQLTRQIEQDIKKTTAEIGIYNEAMRPAKTDAQEKQRLVVQTEAPDYFLDIAQKRASAYYQGKFGLSKEEKTAQHFGGGLRKFEPDNPKVHREYPGACGPFMNARTNAFHLMMPFDIKISRKPDNPLDAGMRAYYCKMGYSFPLGFEMGKICSFQDGEILDISMDDPNLIFLSVSRIKEKEFRALDYPGTPEVPVEYAYPRAVLERTGTLGPYVQVVSNFKIWFDASQTSILIQGAPDLYEYGLEGGSGLMVRSHAADKVPAYVENTSLPWQEGMSFNFVNIHLTLSPGTETAIVPYNTPLFTVYPLLPTQNFKWMDVSEA